MKARKLLVWALWPFALLLGATSSQVMAANCKTRVTPVSQTSVPEGNTVTLNGSGSTPNSGAITSYVWSQPVGQGIVFLTNNSATGIATFTTPQVDAGGRSLSFTLTISGANCDFKSSSDQSETTIINVTNVLGNAAPVASATTTPEPATEGQTVTLDGSGSYDPDGDAITFLWTQEGGNTPVTINNPTSAIATIVAPNTAFPSGASFTFRLRVFDGLLAATTEKIVSVQWDNDKPIALLNCPGTVNEGDTVVLNGSASSDPEGVALTYSWLQLDGPPYVLVDALTATPSITFTAPALGYQNMGFLPFRLVVTDGVLSDSKECTIQIVDVTRPVISGAVNQVLEATAPTGATASYNVTAFDNVGGESLAICVPPSPNTFPLGVHTVACSKEDAAGNVANASFTITVVDRTPPVIAPHDGVTAQATSAAGAIVDYDSPATSDIHDGAGTASCVPASASTFAIGDTTVNCTAQDAAGNLALATQFHVYVIDDIAPVIIPPPDQTFQATGVFTPLTSADYGSATATDAVGVAEESNNAPSQFPLGPTTITWFAKDTVGNTSTAATIITVVDTTAPELTVPANITAEATSSAGAAVSYLATATDLVDSSPDVVCTPSSDSTFALGGPHTVECTATDDTGNQSSDSFSVTVVDTTAPELTVPADITAEATSSAGAAVSYLATATDLVDSSPDVVCTPSSDSTFALGGPHTVECTATDDTGNQSSDSFSVTVVDTTAPELTVPDDFSIEATSGAGAQVTFPATATDLVDSNPTVLCTPASGSTFALGGPHAVDCTATDASGNQSSDSFSVAVVDTTAPELTVPANITAEATSGAGAAISFSATATDLVDSNPTVLCTPASGSTFALGGPHSVECTATDNYGNQRSDSFTVTVVDTTAPVIAPHDPVTAVATSAAGAVVTYSLPTAFDLVDGSVAVTCLPMSGSTFAVASTTVNCRATDGRGNIGYSSFQVTVSYAFNGFFRPVDNIPTINVVKAGQAIPVKFSLGGNMGLGIMASGYPRSVVTNCAGSLTDVVEETLTAGGSSLSYDPTTGQYIYVWKSEKAWAGTCRQLQVQLRDGSEHIANFSFTR